MSFSEDEVRLMGLAAPQLLKLFAAREERLLNRLYGEWNTEKDHTKTLAEWGVIRSQIHEIKHVLDQHYKQEKKRHESATTD